MTTRGLVTWVSIAAALTFGGTYWLLKERTDAARSKAAKASQVAAAKAAAPAPAPQAAAPAAETQPAAPAASAQPAETAAAPVAEHGFPGAPLGVDEAAILASFGSRAQKVPKREQFAGMYVDYVIPEYAMGGVTFQVFFQMDDSTHRLSQVLLRKQADDIALNSYARDFTSVADFLAAKYGAPRGSESQGRRDDTFREEKFWVKEPVVISLGHSQTVWSRSSNEMVTVRYFLQ